MELSFGDVPKWLRELSAKQLCTGSSPVVASNKFCMANSRKELKINGSNLWYLVGLIASDGCLSKDGRHIDLTSKEYDFLREIKIRIGLINKIGVKYNHLKQKNFHIQISNKGFYNFLLSIGLRPDKSLTIGPLAVEGQYFSDFLRGLIDGDGSIRHWAHSSNNREQWSLRIYSGSAKFLEWLREQIRANFNALGRIHEDTSRNTVYVLKFGKMAAREIMQGCYYPGCFGLGRKIKLANACFNSSAGWKSSKTVLN